MLTSKELGDWRRTLNWLQKQQRGVFPVLVRSVRMPHLIYGDTSRRGKLFEIRISKAMSFQERIDTLLHEWAHMLAWNSPNPNEDHGPEWGVAHARLYTAYVKWMEEQRK